MRWYGGAECKDILRVCAGGRIFSPAADFVRARMATCERERMGWRASGVHLLRHSGGVGDGLVLFQPGPLTRGVVHFEDRVHQHGGAARAVRLGQHLRVLAQLDLDDVPLLRARVLCEGREKKNTLSVHLPMNSTN